MKRASLFLLFSLLLGACGEGFTGPEPARVPEDPFYIALLLPAVQQVHSGPTRVETSTTPYILTIGGTLHPDGRASGFLSLVDPDDPARRFHYVLREWSGECVDGTPVISLAGNGHAVSKDARGGTFTHRYSFGFVVEPIEDSRSGSPVLKLTWTVSDPAGHQGEFFLVEVDEFLSPELCEDR